MKSCFTLLLCISIYLNSSAQDLPVKITVPEASTDPNMQFNVLQFDVMEKDKFSVLYFQSLYGSVMHNSEFVSDTGQIVYKDPKLKTPIYNSNTVLLLKKQIFDATGKLLNTEEWLLAARKLDVSGEFKFYFPRGAKYTTVPNRTVIDKSIYNLDAVKNLSQTEMAALVELVQRMIPKEGEAVNYTRTESTIAEDIIATRKQFKALRSTGLCSEEIYHLTKVYSRVTA